MAASLPDPGARVVRSLQKDGVDRVRKTGNHRLAGLLVEELHETLFGRPLRAVFGDPAEW